MFEKFDIDDKNIFKVCVVATMSAGKSTFINSIIGEEIMPEKNEACTARTMAVLDNDSVSVKKAHIIRKNGAKELVEIDSRDVLERVNNDEDVVDFLIETDIPSINNTSRAFVLVDTPGVNNSGDERHGERTEEFIKQMDMGVIMYLLNATQLATNDDSVLLQLVSDFIKKKNGEVKIIFVLNKIDALDEETESIAGTVKIAKEYIQKHGISNPIIYPISALAAKSLRMALYRKEMTKRELRKLEDVYEHYQSKDNNMLDFALVDDLSEEIYEIGELQVSAQQLRRAIDNTGITAIEKRLESFMNDIEKHYAPEVVIKSQLSESTAQEFQQRLDKIASFPSQCEWKKFKELNTKLDTIDAIQKANRELAYLGSVKAHLEMTENISNSSSDINELMSDIELIKKKAFDIFNEGKYIAVKRIAGVYFCPEKVESDRISGRHFYLMSEDGREWESVQFSRVIALVDSGKEFYLYNEYSAFVFKVTKDNSADIVALLDTKIPVKSVKIAGLNIARPSFDEVNAYIENYVANEKEKQAEIERTQEQLKRTYKGIVFSTENEKNSAIDKENELQKYCMNLLDISHEDLWLKKDEVSKFPSTIFSIYLTKLASALEVSENKEKNEFLTQIQIAELDALEGISKEILKHHYSDATNSQLRTAIEQRRLHCQRNNLENQVKNLSTLSRTGLKELSSIISSLGYDENLCREFLLRIDNQYDILEEKELRKLCADIEQCNIEQLDELGILIREGKYQDKFTLKYFDMIAARIEFLHVKNLEYYCIPVKSVDRDKLTEIKELVGKENCKAELKNKFYDLINAREEQLDYEELCLLTDEIESKSLTELDNLYRKLSVGSYNPRLIKAFLVQVRVYLELAQKKQVEDLIIDLSYMPKSQVLETQCKIAGFGYPDRVISLAKENIVERIYELDLYELMSIENDFNRLDLDTIENLRAQIKQKDICERSRNTYYKKLHDRECIIAYEKVSPIACFAKQLIDQNGLNEVGIKLAIFAPEYMSLLDNYFSMGGEKNYSNIPIFFFPECSSLAMTKTDLYYKTMSGYAKAKLSEVRSFSIEKKLFSEVLVITFSNGNVVNLAGGINKKNSAAVVNFFTTLLHNIDNKALLQNYQPYHASIPGLRREDFEFRNVPSAVTEVYIADDMLSKYTFLDGREKSSSIKIAFQENWRELDAKVRNGFGIINERQIILYYDRTFFGSAKEGIAFGVDYIHIKNANQPLISIPYTDVYEIIQQSGKGVIETITNNVYQIDMGNGNNNAIFSLLDEYARGIQLVNLIKVRLKTEPLWYKEERTSNMINTCSKCGAIVKIGAKFCSQCGASTEIKKQNDEYMFCSQCGNKIPKGKKFCSQCGAKIEYGD